MYMIFRTIVLIAIGFTQMSLYGQSNLGNFFDVLKENAEKVDSTFISRDSSKVLMYKIIINIEDSMLLKETISKEGFITSYRLKDYDENLIGPSVSFYKSGVLKRIGFKGDSLGVTISFSEDQRLKEYAHTVFAVAHNYRAQYCSEGELYSEWLYNEDNTECQFRGYHCNGVNRMQGLFSVSGTYMDLKKEGIWTSWLNDGQISFIEYYENGILLDSKRFD